MIWVAMKPSNDPASNTSSCFGCATAEVLPCHKVNHLNPMKITGHLQHEGHESKGYREPNIYADYVILLLPEHCNIYVLHNVEVKHKCEFPVYYSTICWQTNVPALEIYEMMLRHNLEIWFHYPQIKHHALIEQMTHLPILVPPVLMIYSIMHNARNQMT